MFLISLNLLPSIEASQLDSWSLLVGYLQFSTDCTSLSAVTNFLSVLDSSRLQYSYFPLELSPQNYAFRKGKDCLTGIQKYPIGRWWSLPTWEFPINSLSDFLDSFPTFCLWLVDVSVAWPFSSESKKVRWRIYSGLENREEEQLSFGLRISMIWF